MREGSYITLFSLSDVTAFYRMKYGGGGVIYSPGAQGSKMSRAGPKGLKVVSNWKFCAESENQRLTCRTWEVFQIRRHCCHGNNLAKN